MCGIYAIPRDALIQHTWGDAAALTLICDKFTTPGPGLTSLERRRRDAQITILYKMVHGLVNITKEELGLVPSDKRTRASHRYKFKEIEAKVDISKFSYVNRTVPGWNRLPAAVAEADPEDLDIFRTQLASARHP